MDNKIIRRTIPVRVKKSSCYYVCQCGNCETEVEGYKMVFNDDGGWKYYKYDFCPSCGCKIEWGKD